MADLLAQTPAHKIVAGTRTPSLDARPFVARYGVGKPGSGRITAALVPLVIGAGLVTKAAIIAINGWFRAGST